MCGLSHLATTGLSVTLDSLVPILATLCQWLPVLLLPLHQHIILRDRIGRAAQEFRTIINDPLMSSAVILVFANKQVCWCVDRGVRD